MNDSVDSILLKRLGASQIKWGFDARAGKYDVRAVIDEKEHRAVVDAYAVARSTHPGATFVDSVVDQIGRILPGFCRCVGAAVVGAACVWVFTGEAGGAYARGDCPRCNGTGKTPANAATEARAAELSRFSEAIKELEVEPIAVLSGRRGDMVSDAPVATGLISGDCGVPSCTVCRSERAQRGTIAHAPRQEYFAAKAPDYGTAMVVALGAAGRSLAWGMSPGFAQMMQEIADREISRLILGTPRAIGGEYGTPEDHAKWNAAVAGGATVAGKAAALAATLERDPIAKAAVAERTERTPFDSTKPFRYSVKAATLTLDGVTYPVGKVQVTLKRSPPPDLSPLRDLATAIEWGLALDAATAAWREWSPKARVSWDILRGTQDAIALSFRCDGVPNWQRTAIVSLKGGTPEDLRQAVRTARGCLRVEISEAWRAPGAAAEDAAVEARRRRRLAIEGLR